MVSMSMELPLDEGFLRRECPNCERQFKWLHGSDEDQADLGEPAELYFCPYCGEGAPLDQWWTPEQLEHAQQLMLRMASREIGNAFEGINRRQRSNSLIRFEFKRGADPPAPDALHEPEDMVRIEPPCHPLEPVKIAEDWRDPVHCLRCGAAFAL